MTDSVHDDVAAFIRANFLLGDDKSIAYEESLMDSRVVDSTGFLELVAFLEERYGFTVADEEMAPENLDSIAAIAAFVARKRGGSA